LFLSLSLGFSGGLEGFVFGGGDGMGMLMPYATTAAHKGGKRWRGYGGDRLVSELSGGYIYRGADEESANADASSDVITFDHNLEVVVGYKKEKTINGTFYNLHTARRYKRGRLRGNYFRKIRT